MARERQADLARRARNLEEENQYLRAEVQSGKDLMRRFLIAETERLEILDKMRKHVHEPAEDR
jgi:hypothetical protein